MGRYYTMEEKFRIMQENITILRILYYCGAGVMLRQQLVKIAVVMLNLPAVVVEVRLSELTRAGVIGSTKLFSGCKNKIMYSEKIASGFVRNIDPKTCAGVRISPSNSLYNIFKTEYISEHLKDVNTLINPPFVIRKNQTKRLYNWVENNLKTKELTFEYSFIPEKGNPLAKQFVKSTVPFDAQSLLANNFLFKSMETDLDGYVLKVCFINSENVDVNTYYQKVCRLVAMLQFFIDCKFKFVEVEVLFFSTIERDLFIRLYDQNYLDRQVSIKRYQGYTAESVTIKPFSLDLDTKYNLFRDLQI